LQILHIATEYKLPNIEIVYNIVWLCKRIDVQKSLFRSPKQWKWT